MKEASLEEILVLEKDMLQKGEQSSAELRRWANGEAYAALRECQCRAWEVPMLEGCLQDLKTACDRGANPLLERYKYAVKQMDPEAGAAIRTVVPDWSLEKAWLVDWISEAHRVWRLELKRRFPAAAGWLREVLVRCTAATPEALLFGELMSYSVGTLRQYAAHAEKLQKNGLNLDAQVLQNILLRYEDRLPEEVREQIPNSARAVCGE